MKLLVIGAGGETGEAVVEQALAVGHTVTAFVHSPAEYKRTGIRVVAGDARDKTIMLEAVHGQDVILGHLGEGIYRFSARLSKRTPPSTSWKR